MLKKILVANRGEIACRVFATAKKMGIATVAVYSDADRDALHVQMADEAVYIGSSVSAESYLVIEKIIQACLDTGADAVHPGYGFLSENNKFRDALDTAGIIFIGPGKKAIESMGDKITSKLIAQKAGVNCIPGYTDVVRDADHALEVCAEIGYPVMLKASAGGGGKGMRVAMNEDECRDGFERATNEARSSFGDTRIFIEKYIQQPRHIEIQVMADGHGNVIYLGERECSIQRRHQKVIEEAPSPFLNETTRQKMGEQSCALARAVDYQSAGTVEFIADADMNFYFLEMNTRLQVEHPVTELVTGQDLVELMIRVAAGEELPLTQQDVSLTGWAMESRVYAEDPFRNFLPSVGRLVRYSEPEGEGVRVDSGVYEGGEVSIFYDPMIAKLITYGEDRSQSIDRMVDALDNYYIRGVNHNISFLNALMVHPRFIAGDLSTNFIADEFPDGFNADLVVQADPAIALVVVGAVHQLQEERASLLSNQLTGHEHIANRDWVLVVGDQHSTVSVDLTESGYLVSLDNSDYQVETNWSLGEPLFKATVNDKDISVQVESGAKGYKLFYQGAEINAQVLSPKATMLSAHMIFKAPADTSKFLLSPMPGLLVKMAVQEGQEIKEGEELAVVEAMKMENSLRAVQDGIVAKISAIEGDSLMVDEIILEFE
ncbi:MAG: acetyl/propionyl/methylcrotonyl-CoA carboxylase subunit alpha [Porticoccaceae bacterium]|jgi:propionyl-CoA carboxylase alpha chain|nr:acetyl/propionyl/methylcrotonyl-CoA carboxylase subunit alpha [Porticoccaceae bacterium]MBT4165073.1 acetyl/propionyl/methylcrotonyl-CoA carboxylase subunit alpha [Porticoccaceae bacterium]MBT4212264.1 acetyl/propionyl/methylcrotonyl-CoA carboxylase subunit alpha [Porticoccaceae bacterium]MBT4592463.1 acetyl/propionyl/methylcrotonyl-CoA carboxylase subunit alpha [Porticoccaceae bacterium]MBT5003811.1 acetyl/propionyl/methylcrotonyl-CoA carboxylase subunit alpha [Porticoccaceae bacterium]